MTIQALALLALAQAPTIAEIPFRIGDDAIIVDAKVNGKDVSLMFDTGFAGSFVIGPHISLGKPDGKMGLKDFVGVFEANTIKINTIEFGALRPPVEDMHVVQLPTMDYTQSYGTHVDGIMGLEPLRGYVLEINFEKNKFIVHPDTHDISKLQPDGQKTFLTRMLPVGHNSIELSVRVKTGKQIILALDTGNAFYATTHKDVLESVGLWRSGTQPKFMQQSMVASGAVDSWNIVMEDAQIFGIPVAKSVWNIIDLPASDAQHQGTVGFGFLKHFNVTLDLKRRRVWFDNFSGQVADDPPAEVGLAATYHPREQRMFIVDVTPDSPAERAGIKVGDFLISVGEENLVRSTYRHVSSLLTGKEGTEVQIAVSSGGVLKRLTLKRELLINVGT